MRETYTWNERQKELAFLEVEKISLLIQKLERGLYIPPEEYMGEVSDFCREYYGKGLCASCCPLKVLKEPCEDLDNKDVAWFNMAQALGKRNKKVALTWATYLRELCSFVAGIRGIKPIRPIKFIERKKDAKEK